MNGPIYRAHMQKAVDRAPSSTQEWRAWIEKDEPDKLMISEGIVGESFKTIEMASANGAATLIGNLQLAVAEKKSDGWSPVLISVEEPTPRISRYEPLNHNLYFQASGSTEDAIKIVRSIEHCLGHGIAQWLEPKEIEVLLAGASGPAKKWSTTLQIASHRVKIQTSTKAQGTIASCSAPKGSMAAQLLFALSAGRLGAWWVVTDEHGVTLDPVGEVESWTETPEWLEETAVSCAAIRKRVRWAQPWSSQGNGIAPAVF